MSGVSADQVASTVSRHAVTDGVVYSRKLLLISLGPFREKSHDP